MALTADQATEVLDSGAPRIEATFRNLSDLYLLGEDGYLPVTQFLNKKETEHVCETMHLTTGEPWSIPIIFPISAEQAKQLEGASSVILLDGDKPAGVITIEEIFEINKPLYNKHIFRTEDEAHPGVEWLRDAGDYSIAGKAEVFPDWKLEISGGLAISPREVKDQISEMGWRTVVGFQTRNPIHRAHEFCTKIALETADGLVIHPLLGETKPGDTPAEVRLACYDVLVKNYYSPNHTLLAGFPAWMRYAGPREAVFHAQVRKNYGITHFIVGRDHAGVGNYYGSFDAQHIFSEFQPGELGVDVIFFDFVHFCAKCGGMASKKTCPHGPEHHVHLSGTKVRAMLAEGQLPPAEFTRPEIAMILLEAAKAEQ
ncbi:MAG: sulfate adenylyltransferase [Acidobacteria bacterium]|nr:sulfate adenylyltransferase [Acidobacteriota bacterium]